MKTPSLDTRLARWLISDSAHVAVWGEPTIDQHQGVTKATWIGASSRDRRFGTLDVELCLRVKSMRADAPTVLLLCQQHRIAWRVEHNGKHMERGTLRQQTHLQLDGDKDFIEWLDPVRLCSPQIGSENVDNDALYRLLRATAAELHIDIRGLRWAQLPEGGQS